jgi:hypothetical protein
VSAAVSTVTGVTDRNRHRQLYRFELEPEVRDWLDSLSDSDFKRVDEVAGMLAEKGPGLGGPWSDHLEGRRMGTAAPASPDGGQGNVLVQARWRDRAADGVPENPPA